MVLYHLSMVEKAGNWDAKRIRTLRISLSETQESFARRLGISFVSVSRWEGGHAKPSALARRLLDEIEAGTKGAPA